MKTVVITGSSDGIGAHAARQLKALGHRVVIVGRNVEKTQAIADELDAPYHIADFSRLDDVVRLADELSQYPRIDVLANNAGALMKSRCITADGFEMTFQVNVLAGFLLTMRLLDKLRESNATVIQTSSIASNLFGKGLDINDLQGEKAYSTIKAYGASKLCDVLFTRELNRRYKDINAVAFEPGIARSNFASEGRTWLRFAYHSPLKYVFTVSPKSSARRLVRLATGVPGRDFICGETYSYKKPYKIEFRDDDGSIATTLWERCEQYTKKLR